MFISQASSSDIGVWYKYKFVIFTVSSLNFYEATTVILGSEHVFTGDVMDFSTLPLAILNIIATYMKYEQL